MTRHSVRVMVVADMGHSLWKIGVRADGDWRFAVAPHALHQVQARQWAQIVERSRDQANAVDYVQCGQDYFVMGASAENYGHATRRMGAARYSRDYIGIQAISMAARVTEHDEAELIVMALHPPSDAEYTRDLRKALKGKWDLEFGDGRACLYNVTQVITVDEPVAGLMNVALDERLRENRRITGGAVLVLDVGGGTTSVAPVLTGGAVDYARVDSFPMGILNVTSRLQKYLMNQHRNLFMKTRIIPQDRLRETLVTEKFRGGGRTVPCEDEVRQAKRELLDEIDRMYHDGMIGGPLGFDSIVLTGGGAVAMGDDLRSLLDHKTIHLAASPEQIHLANVFGAAKLMDVFEAEGRVQL